MISSKHTICAVDRSIASDSNLGGIEPVVVDGLVPLLGPSIAGRTAKTVIPKANAELHCRPPVFACSDSL